MSPKSFSSPRYHHPRPALTMASALAPSPASRWQTLAAHLTPADEHRSFDFPVDLIPASGGHVTFGWEPEDEQVDPFSASPPPAASTSGSGSDSEAATTSSSPSLDTPSSSKSIDAQTKEHNVPAVSPSSSSPTLSAPTQTALITPSLSSGWAHCFSLSRTWPLPTSSSLAPDEVLIRNLTVGLNHVDFKSLLYRFGMGRLPWVLGRDVCGVVEAVGSDEEGRKDGLRVGERVWTCTDSARDKRAGAYQEYSVCKAFTVGRLPAASTGGVEVEAAATVTDESAATIGTGLVTAGVALHWFFDLPRATSLGGGLYPRSEKRPPTPSAPKSGRTPWLLIYGGATVTGIYAAQLARLSGLKVVSVASPGSFEYLRKVVGVDACVDRFASTEKVLEAIWEATKGEEGVKGDLRYALDCVGSATASLCARALAESGSSESDEELPPAQLICLAGNPKRAREDDDEDGANTSGRTPREVLTPRISFSTTFYSDATWTRSFLSSMHSLLSSGLLKPVEAEVVPDGLAGVRRGLEMLKDGRAWPASSTSGASSGGGRKLVVRIKDTPPVEVTHLGLRRELGWNGCV